MKFMIATLFLVATCTISCVATKAKTHGEITLTSAEAIELQRQYDKLYQRWQQDHADRTVERYQFLRHIERLHSELKDLTIYNQSNGHEALDRIKKLEKQFNEKFPPDTGPANDKEEYFD